METYLISYDLAEKNNYDSLYQAIKEYGTWAHITESLWAIKTESTATEVRDNLVKYFSNGSRLMVIKSGTESAWRNVICSNEWLKKNL
jgi:phosphomannomutase